MPYRKIPLVNGQIYHIFNRGVAKLPIFNNERDYRRFLESIYYYQFHGPKPQFSQLKRYKNFNFEKNGRIVELLCYCLMPNHFHFLLKQIHEGGISEFVRKLANSYTKYFNTKHKRVGPLLQGQFKAVRIESDEQLIHVSRYIHLNPTSSFLVKDLRTYAWSSYSDYVGVTSESICQMEEILSMFKNRKNYEQFVLDQKDYAKTLELIKHKTFE